MKIRFRRSRNIESLSDKKPTCLPLPSLPIPAPNLQQLTKVILLQGLEVELLKFLLEKEYHPS